MDREETSDEVSQEEFVAGVLSGGMRQGAMLQLAIAASPAPGTRASDVRHLARFVNEVLSILRAPINPFEGMLEAPSPIVRLYQAHKQSMKDLRTHRDEALEPLLRAALAGLYRRFPAIVATPEVFGSCDGSWSTRSGAADREA